MRKKYFVICFLLVGIIGVTTFGTAAAYVPRNQPHLPELLPYEDFVEIINANYLDLDEDGIEDDIVTEFIFRVPTMNLATLECELYMELELPSGYTFYADYDFTETFVEVTVLMEWYNVATESGDYIFTVQIDFEGMDEMGYYMEGSFTESIIFDPPIDGPVGGLPFGIIYLGF